MKVTLSHCTPLYIASDGARTCWQSYDKSDTIPLISVPQPIGFLDKDTNTM